MNGEGNFSELFDRYLEGELSFHEKKEFESRINEDPVLAELFRLHKEVDYSLIEEDILNFREKLGKIQVGNPDLMEDSPMISSTSTEGIFDQAAIDQDLAILREQLNTIHASFAEQETADPVPQYSGNELGRLDSEVDQAIIQEDVMSLRVMLDQIGNRVTDSGKQVDRRRKVKRLAFAAAVITLFIVTGSTLTFVFSGSSPGKHLIKNQFGPYIGLNEHRGQTYLDNELFKAGLDKYNKGDFGGAFEMLDLSIRGGNESDLAILYTGISALQAGIPEKAEDYLVRLSREALVGEQAEWYLAGSRIALNKMDAAIALLRKIEESPDHFYSEQARTLLNKLDKRHK